MEDIKDFLQKNNYLVIREDRNYQLYSSLRNIAKDICIDYTTISKKINESKKYDCFCKSKQTEEIFYIKKLN